MNSFDNMIDSFMSKVSPEPNSGCWIWTGATDASKKNKWKGYGVFRYRAAHRVSYELFVGPLIPGLYICHRCDMPLCVNPAHLFQATNRENQIDCNRKGRRKRMMTTHCRYGHELSGHNLAFEKRKDPLRAPRRRCRACRDARFEELKNRGK